VVTARDQRLGWFSRSPSSPARFLTAPAAEARVTHIVIDRTRSQSPTFGGRAFGTVGQYEKLRGTAFGVLDPADRHNAVITDIELAPRNRDGMVEYSTDLFILKPIDVKNGNHRLFIDYNNRGQMRLGRLNDVELTNNPTTAADAGTGFVMNLGYSIVSMGWDFGATGFDSMKISVPVFGPAAQPDHRRLSGVPRDRQHPVGGVQSIDPPGAVHAPAQRAMPAAVPRAVLPEPTGERVRELHPRERAAQSAVRAARWHVCLRLRRQLQPELAHQRPEKSQRDVDHGESVVTRG